MAKKKTAAAEKLNAEKKARVRWPFPRTTLEEALKIAYALKEHNGGNPWEPGEIRKAIGAGTGGNAYFYLTAASRDYGLTTGHEGRREDCAYRCWSRTRIRAESRDREGSEGSSVPQHRHLQTRT